MAAPKEIAVLFYEGNDEIEFTGSNKVAIADGDKAAELNSLHSGTIRGNVALADHNTAAFTADCYNADGSLSGKGHYEMGKQVGLAVGGTSDRFPDLYDLTTAPAPKAYSEITVDDLPEGEDYTLTITAADLSLRLPVMAGTVGGGMAAEYAPQLTAAQQAIADLASSDESVTWIFMGDSITHGWVHTHGYDSVSQIFEKFLKDDLGRTDDIVINTAVSNRMDPPVTFENGTATLDTTEPANAYGQSLYLVKFMATDAEGRVYSAEGQVGDTLTLSNLPENVTFFAEATQASSGTWVRFGVEKKDVALAIGETVTFQDNTGYYVDADTTELDANVATVEITGTVTETAMAATEAVTSITDGDYIIVNTRANKPVTTGTGDGSTFSPYGELQRAQFVTFLWRAAGSPEPTSSYNPFDDVKETDFFYKAVLWAVENNITNGISPTEFGAYSITNRAQAVTFLYRALA